MLFRTQIIFCSSEVRLHFRIAEVGSLLSLNRAWRAQVTRRKHDIHIVGFRHTFAKRCIRINLPQTVNNTPESVKDKLFTHSFRGFVNFAKLTFLQNYKNECTMANCYICDRVQH